MIVSPEALATIAKKLKIPCPDQRTLDILSVNEKDALSRAISVIETDPAAVTFFRAAMMCCHEKTRARLENRRIAALDVPVLMSIARSEGEQFALVVKSFDEEFGQDQAADDERTKWIRLSIARAVDRLRGMTNTNHLPPPPAQRRVTQQAADEAPPAPRARPQLVPQSPDVVRSHQQESTGFADDDRDNEPIHQAHDDQSAQSGRDPSQYHSFHVYANKAAACFSADESRSKMNTVRIEAASSAGNRSYDWKSKISIQLSSRELPLVLAVFLGMSERFEGKGHGQNNEKWFTLEKQGDKFYLSVNSKGAQTKGVPIMAGDAYPITTMLMKQMIKNDPFLTSEALFRLVKIQAEMASTAPRQRAAA